MFKPMVIKTSIERIKECNGNLDPAIQEAWYVNFNRASQYTHVVVTFRGCRDIKAIYKIEEWEHGWKNRYIFKGYRDIFMENKLLGKELNPILFKQGRRNPVAYMEENELLAS